MSLNPSCKMPGAVHRAHGCAINVECGALGRCCGWSPPALPQADGKAEVMTFGLPNRTGGYEHDAKNAREARELDQAKAMYLNAVTSMHDLKEPPTRGGSRASGPLLDGIVDVAVDAYKTMHSSPLLVPCASDVPETGMSTSPLTLPKLREDYTAKDRKERPLCSGVLDYFPDALLEVAYCSYIGNEQHNPGEPLHWAKEKSSDEPDAQLRHLIDRGTLDKDGVRHSAKNAWRALALLQREIDAERRAR